MPNDQLFIDTLAQIERDPKRWNQERWAKQTPCGTSYCFAGWAVTLSGFNELEWINDWATYDVVSYKLQDGRQIEDVARQLLQITTWSTNALFHPRNSLERIYDHVAEILGLDKTVLKDKVKDAIDG